MNSNNQNNIAPVFHEVFCYFLDNNIDIVKVQYFYNYYTLKGWTKNNNKPILDWKKEVDEWFNNEIIEQTEE